MKKRRGCILAIIVFLIIIMFPYARAEVLTKLYGDEFKELYKITGWLHQLDYLKVNHYSETQAEVYYIGDDHQAVFIYYFIFDNEWKLKDWKCVWAKHGNADEFVWPYYR